MKVGAVACDCHSGQERGAGAVVIPSGGAAVEGDGPAKQSKSLPMETGRGIV